MIPSDSLAFKVTLPDGATFYAAGLTALDARLATPPTRPTPEGVFWYLMGSNTILDGYSFWATEFRPMGEGTSRYAARFYVGAGVFAPKPVVLQVASRDQVEGDYESPVEFNEQELSDQNLIQTLLVAALVYPGFENLVHEKLASGFVRVPST